MMAPQRYRGGAGDALCGAGRDIARHRDTWRDRIAVLIVSDLDYLEAKAELQTVLAVALLGHADRAGGL
jgi:hypothetical protein